MSAFKGIVKLSQEQFELLKTNGTLTVGETTITYEPTTTTYVTPYKSDSSPDQRSISATGDVYQKISPNVFYNFIANNITSLTIEFGTPISMKVNEYMFQFVAGAGFTGLTMPEGIIWFGGTAPTFTEGKTYQVSVLNNLAVLGEF